MIKFNLSLMVEIVNIHDIAPKNQYDDYLILRIK